MAHLEKLKIDELKLRLKQVGMVQGGEKGTLVSRLKLHETCVAHKLEVNGANPCTLKIGDLRSACARAGVSPIGSQDEMLELLVRHLEKTAPKQAASSSSSSSSSSSASSSSSSDAAASGEIDAAAVCARVLELAETDDWEAILSLAAPPPPAPPLSRSSPSNVLRKAYLKLAVLIHPDKLAHVPDATKAFQALVRAYERLSAPDAPADAAPSAGAGGAKVATLARSNQGCYRTQVCCPRCKTAWGDAVDGNPEYFYNFLMQGLKQYTCSTCLCEFGCMTAIHKCPHCRQRFEYAPADYHRKITCGNGGAGVIAGPAGSGSGKASGKGRAACAGEFGFWMFHASDRVLNDLRTEIRAEVERCEDTRYIDTRLIVLFRTIRIVFCD